MHASFLCILAISSLALALPMHKGSNKACANMANSAANSTDLDAISAGFIAANKSDPNPALAAARLQIVDGLGSTDNALQKISAQAAATNNNGVQDLVMQAQSALANATMGTANIEAAVSSGQKPETADQKTVALGINAAGSAIRGMEAAITSPDKKLSSNIADAVASVLSLGEGGDADLAASNLTLADLGLGNSTAVA